MDHVLDPPTTDFSSDSEAKAVSSAPSSPPDTKKQSEPSTRSHPIPASAAAEAKDVKELQDEIEKLQQALKKAKQQHLEPKVSN